MLELSARQIQRPKCYDGRCRINVAFLAIMPSPYMRDLFEVMAADPQFDLRVYYLEMTAPDTHWGDVPLPRYAEILPGKWMWFMGGRIHFNPGAARRICAQPRCCCCYWIFGDHEPACHAQLRRRRIPSDFFW